jgi:hypothetical protein
MMIDACFKVDKYSRLLACRSLYDNNLTGPVPSTIGQLAALSHLSLYSNQLNGTIPMMIGELYSLKVLYAPTCRRF